MVQHWDKLCKNYCDQLSDIYAMRKSEQNNYEIDETNEILPFFVTLIYIFIILLFLPKNKFDNNFDNIVDSIFPSYVTI